MKTSYLVGGGLALVALIYLMNRSKQTTTYIPGTMGRPVTVGGNNAIGQDIAIGGSIAADIADIFRSPSSSVSASSPTDPTFYQDPTTGDFGID